MFLGYNTYGLAHHDLFDAVSLLADIGYRGVAITIDHNALPPGDLSMFHAGDCPNFCGDCPNFRLSENGTVPLGESGGRIKSAEQIAQLRDMLKTLAMRSVIETGARFLLDPRVKHEPTLLSDLRRRRIDFYKYAVDCAAALGSDCVSLWSGAANTPLAASHASPTGKDFREQMMARLVEGLREVLDYAAAKNVIIAFEPEPGMFIDTMSAFEELLAQIDGPNLRLTLDIGHLQCQGELPIAEVIRRWSPRLANVHIEDMRRGVHEHLMFGEGEIDFPPVLQALADVNYSGGLYVELSRHSHAGPAKALQAFQWMERLWNGRAENRE